MINEWHFLVTSDRCHHPFAFSRYVCESIHWDRIGVSEKATGNYSPRGLLDKSETDSLIRERKIRVTEGEAFSEKKWSTCHLSDVNRNKTTIRTALCCSSNFSSRLEMKNVFFSLLIRKFVHRRDEMDTCVEVHSVSRSTQKQSIASAAKKKSVAENFDSSRIDYLTEVFDRVKSQLHARLVTSVLDIVKKNEKFRRVTNGCFEYIPIIALCMGKHPHPSIFCAQGRSSSRFEHLRT